MNSRGRYRPGIGGAGGGNTNPNPNYQQRNPNPNQQYVQRNFMQNPQQFNQQPHPNTQQQWLRRSQIGGDSGAEEVEKMGVVIVIPRLVCNDGLEWRPPDAGLPYLNVKRSHGVKGISELGLKALPKQYIQPLEERIDLTKVLNKESIPVIDMANVDDPNVADQIVDAAEKWGFFQIINHGVPIDVLDNVKEATRGFFQLPAEEKIKFSQENSLTKNVRFGTSFIPKAEKALEWKDYLSLFYVSDEESSRYWPSACNHSKCLADLCGALHCDLVTDFKSRKAKCNPSASARNKHLCEGLADKCFPVNHGPSANRLHELFLRQFCDARTCSGGQRPFSRGGKKHTSIFYLAISVLTLLLVAIFYAVVYVYRRRMRKDNQGFKRISRRGQKPKPS